MYSSVCYSPGWECNDPRVVCVCVSVAQVLGGKLEDATRFYFRLYDIDGDGTVSREEVMKLFMSSKVGAENARENAVNLLKVSFRVREIQECLLS